MGSDTNPLSQSIASRLAGFFGLSKNTDSGDQPARISMPGTSVILEIPDGFTLSNDGTNLENPATGASFSVTELPSDTLDHITEMFASEGAAATAFDDQNVVISSTITITHGGKDHKIYCGSQDIEGVSYFKWLSAFLGTKPVILAFQSPKESDLESEKIKRVFSSLVLTSPPDLAEQIALLPYQFGDLAGFRIVGIFEQKNALLTIGERDQDERGEQPFIIVSPSFTQAPPPEDLESHGWALLSDTDGLNSLEFIDGAEILFAGKRAYFLRAEARKVSTGQRIRLFQIIRYESNSYIRILGFARAEQATDIGQKIGTLVHAMSFPDIDHPVVTGH